MLNVNEILTSAAIAAFSVAFCWIMTDPDMIFGKPYEWVKKRLENYEWIWFPLWGCPKCFSGQFSFWAFLYWRWYSYDFIAHIIFTGLTVFIAWHLMNHYIKQSKHGKEE